MHHSLADVPARIRRALDTRLWPAVYTGRVPVTIEAAHLPGEPVGVREALDLAYAPFAAGTPWGRPWETTWFRLTARVPKSMAGRRVDLLVDPGFTDEGPGFQCEGLAYDRDGVPIKGVAPRSSWVPVAATASGAEDVEVYVEAAANPAFTRTVPSDDGDLATRRDSPIYTFAGAWLAVFEPDVFHLALDVEALWAVASEKPHRDQRRAEILRGVGEALDVLDAAGDIPAAARAAREVLAPLLARRASETSMELSAVGHAHIDTAWLWPLRETLRKCSRSFSNVAALAADYPDLVFAAPQAVQQWWMKERYPAVFERIRGLAASGQWRPVGGMWVESDAVMVGGEALVRQFVQGQRFFRDEYGVTCHVAWLPDSFGYSGALPQVCRLAGARYFLTQKMSWNRTNVFPHSTFWWEGIDGTRVFTHFPPADTYNAAFTGRELAMSETNFKDLGHTSKALALYGYGDGGGGPTREMVELAHRFADLEGAPKVVLRSPQEFFEAAEADYPDAPVWSGEMYLEFHRGVWTSQVGMKQGNRAMEHLLYEAELWSTQAALAGALDYPYDELRALWREMLTLQFHDILPGSSIAWVHREAREAYATMIDATTRLIDNAQRALAGDGTRRVVFNAAPHARAGVPARGGAYADGRRPGSVGVERTDQGIVLTNGLVRVVVASDGTVTSARVGDREALAGPANVLQLHPDHPNLYDAWDIDEFHRRTSTDITGVDALEIDGDAVVVRRSHRSSTYVQRIALAPDAARLDFTFEADWQESEMLLKVAFPLAVHARHTTSETQFGFVERSTSDNTTWDAAQFEICAHRFLHVAEPGFGVALVNKATYGHDVQRPASGDRRGASETVVRLSLLRAPAYPDPQTDRGRHRIDYALVLDAGVPDAVREGWAMGVPERVVTGGVAVDPVVTCSNPDVVVSAVKLAEDGSGDVIVRCYESLGGRAATTIGLAAPYRSVEVVDLLEDADPEVAELAPIEAAADGVRLRVGPFQIVTLRFRR